MKAIPTTVWILAAMVLGAVAGAAIGAPMMAVGDLGKLVIQVIKAAATPLLFLAIVRALMTTDVRGRAGARMVGFAFTNAVIALGWGLLLSNLLQPGLHLQVMAPAAGDVSAYADKKVDLLKTLGSYVPANVLSPFIDNSVISIILIAVALGLGLRRVRAEQEREGETGYRAVEDALTTLLRAVEVVLHALTRLIPLAVFAVVARTVAEFGFAPMKGLAVYVGVGLIGLMLQALVTYPLWLLLWVKMPLRRFFGEARHPMAYALGTNSSLATLPMTLTALRKLGVSREASTLGACVGTNLNNDGILLYEGMAVLFVAQASGIHLTFAQQAVAASTSIIAAMGVAGVPEAGFVSLALVLNTVGLPLELLPLLLTVDWVLARGRSVVNVLSDMMLSILIDGRRAADVDSVTGP